MSKSAYNGFTLVEVTLSLGIAAFCMTALFGLLPVGLNSNQAAIEQTAAASLASTFAADLRANPTDKLSPRYAIDRTQLYDKVQTVFVADGGGRVDLASQARHRVTVRCIPPVIPASATLPQKSATAVRLLVTWPATADANPQTAPTRYTGAFDSTIALDRN